MAASERRREDIQKEREDWREWKKTISPKRLIFLDETGIKTNFVPRYGWAKRGCACMAEAPGRWKSYSLVAAIGLSGIVESATVEGAVNSESFKEFMEDILLPSLKRGDIVVMDNLAVHKRSFDVRKFLRRGIQIKFLPRYSPDLNPIEMMWAKMKDIIRRACARTYDELWQAVNKALFTISRDNIAGWFRGCGYFH